MKGRTVRDESFVAASAVGVLPDINHNGPLGELRACRELSVNSALECLDGLGRVAREDLVRMGFGRGRKGRANVEVGLSSRRVSLSLDEINERGAEDGGEEDGCKLELHCKSAGLES